MKANKELKHSDLHIKNLKIAKYALKDTLLSFSPRAEIAETQTQALIIW